MTLGNRTNIQLVGALGRDVQQAAADELASKMLPVLSAIRADVDHSMVAIASYQPRNALRRQRRWLKAMGDANR